MITNDCREAFETWAREKGYFFTDCRDAPLTSVAREAWNAARDHYAPKLTEAVEIACKAAWERDYPDGGSIYKTYESTNPQDKELYRKEVLPIIKALAAAGVRFKPNSTEG